MHPGWMRGYGSWGPRNGIWWPIGSREILRFQTSNSPLPPKQKASIKNRQRQLPIQLPRLVFNYLSYKLENHNYRISGKKASASWENLKRVDKIVIWRIFQQDEAWERPRFHWFKHLLSYLAHIGGTDSPVYRGLRVRTGNGGQTTIIEACVTEQEQRRQGREWAPPS